MTTSSRFLVRAGGAGAAVALAVTLAACSSSGSTGSGGSPAGNGGGSSADSASVSAPAAATGTGSATLPSGQPGKGKPAITIGDKNFAEEYLLGQLYTQALKARGYTVTLKGNIGASAIIDKALTSGQIDMYPEYDGVIYTELAKLGDTTKTPDATLAGATKWENGRGFAVLNPTPFQDADGLAVTPSYAKKYNLKTIADLKKVGSFTYIGPPENATRFQGVVGLKKAYGLSNLKFKPLTIGSQYQALKQGDAQAVATFTTDVLVTTGKCGCTVLTDNKHIFGFQQVVPVVSKKVLQAEGPEFEQTINAVSALLTQKAINALNEQTQINQQNPATVAKAFLQANGFLK